MAIEIKVPTLGESVADATVARWMKNTGDAVAADEPVVELETDKVNVEVPAPVAGTLGEITAKKGAVVEVGAVLAMLNDGAGAPAARAAAPAAKTPPPAKKAAAKKAAPATGGEAIEIIVPALGESVSDATVAQWLKGTGDAVAQDEPVVELETDKVNIEVPAPVAGALGEITAKKGTVVEVGAVLAILNAGADASAADADTAAAPAPSPQAGTGGRAGAPHLSPAVRRLVEEHGLDAGAITPTGPAGRLTKGDVLAYVESGGQAGGVAAGAATATAAATGAAAGVSTSGIAGQGDAAREERVPMSKLRQVIARRLKQAQNNAAMLTTFNEVDMSQVMALRKRYRDKFEATHGVRLGFMGVFVLAAVDALRNFPAVNAEIDGTDIVYKNYYNIGVAVGTEQGLVVPVVRDAERAGLAGIERTIADFGDRARKGKITPDEMAGGTFTITNGGVYGSMMSTPILNPPQSAILGMHKIEKRAVVVDDNIVVRPMMYLALSYDHRIVDGREAVSFLVRIKDMIEDPQRLVLGV